MSQDILHRFIFENIAARGMIVQLNKSWERLQERKSYPAVIRNILGEFTAANALLAATLKFTGSLSMQIRGNGPVSLMVMECTSDQHLRGLAKFDENVQQSSLRDLFGDGQLALTIDNDKTGERYQGIVELTGDKISHALEKYLMQSEQLETRLFLATNNEKACGLLIQKLPGEPDANSDDWNRIIQLAETIKDEELFELEASEIIHRLFNEDDVRLLESDFYQFRCTCTRERVSNMLISLGREEVKSILDEMGKIEIHCEFCNQHYEFDAVDAEELFATDIHHPTPRTRH